jgi:hypothetical protein
MTMTITVQSGTWAGFPIRKARKPGRCDYWRGVDGRCKARIHAGDYYQQGEMNDDAGGYGNDRYCMDCAGDEAKASLAAALADKA